MKIEHTRYEGVRIDGDQFQLHSQGKDFFVSIYCKPGEKFSSGSSATMRVTPEKIDALIEYLQEVRFTLMTRPETEDEG